MACRGVPAGQPFNSTGTTRCHLTTDQKVILVRLCSQHGEEYLATRKEAFWSSMTRCLDWRMCCAITTTIKNIVKKTLLLTSLVSMPFTSSLSYLGWEGRGLGPVNLNVLTVFFLRFCSGDSYPKLCAQRNDEGEGSPMLWS
jgi:hypothetical protein